MAVTRCTQPTTNHLDVEMSTAERHHEAASAPVARALEVEVEVQDAAVKRALESTPANQQQQHAHMQQGAAGQL